MQKLESEFTPKLICTCHKAFLFSLQGKETLIGVSITDMQVCKRYHGQTVFTDVRSVTITITFFHIDYVAHHFVAIISKVVMWSNCRVQQMDCKKDWQQWRGKTVLVAKMRNGDLNDESSGTGDLN